MAAENVSSDLCTKRKNCGRPRNHPGTCNKKRKMDIKIWEYSSVHKARKRDQLNNEVEELCSAKTSLQEQTTALQEEKTTLLDETETIKSEKNKLEKKFNSFKLLVEQKLSSKTIRERNPTTWKSIHDSKSTTHYNRQNNTKMLLEYIHGGSDGSVYGAWDFLCRYASDDLLEKFFLERKKGKFFERLYGKFGTIYKASDEAMNQAVAEKYKMHLSRRKYTFKCKIQRAMFDPEAQEWKEKSINYNERNIILREKPISHESVQKFVATLDMGQIHNIPGYCGGFRTITALCTMVIDLHLKTKTLHDKLIWFNGITNHFICEFSDDGAPETKEKTMSIGSISFWNFGSRIRSRNYHYPLHMVSAQEKEQVCANLWQQHAEEMVMIEGNSFTINNEKVTIEFQPSADQAWQFWANNELTQSATYPSMFAKVRKDELTFIGGSIGGEDAKWVVPTMNSRLRDLDILEKKRAELRELSLSDENFHAQELEFMAEKGIRQFGMPIIGIFADRQRPEPFHLEVNNWQHILDLIYLIAVQNNYCESFLEILGAPVTSNGCGMAYIAKELRNHFNSADRSKKIPIRLIGENAIQLSRYSFRLIDFMIEKNSGVNETLEISLLALVKICEKLCTIGTLINSVTVDNTVVNEIAESCMLYFNLFSLFFKHACNSTVWTIGYVVPYHARLLFTQYKVGYGILSMQGKESKHSGIKQELKMGTNRSNAEGEKGKWGQLFRADYVRNFYLPYHFPIESYKPHYSSRLPRSEGDNVCTCLRLIGAMEKICVFCRNAYSIMECARAGALTPVVKDKLLPIKCTECSMQFSDRNGLTAHKATHDISHKQDNSIDPRRLTVQQLREELLLRNPNACVKGNKSELVNRLEAVIFSES